MESPAKCRPPISYIWYSLGFKMQTAGDAPYIPVLKTLLLRLSPHSRYPHESSCSVMSGYPGRDLACTYALKRTKPRPLTSIAAYRSSIISYIGLNLATEAMSLSILTGSSTHPFLGSKRFPPGSPVSNDVTLGISPLTQTMSPATACPSACFSTIPPAASICSKVGSGGKRAITLS